MNEKQKPIRCFDRFDNELKAGDTVNVQRAGEHVIYEEADGQLYFEPYGMAERVCAYFKNDLTKVNKPIDKMKTFVEKFIAEKTLTELDLEFPNYSGDVRNEVMIPHNKLSHAEAPSMDIDDAIKILNELKEMGSNRVYIADHCDHNGYHFYGVKLVEI